MRKHRRYRTSSDGCRGARHQVVTFAGEAGVLAFLRNPDNHDSDGPGLIELGKFSDSTCLTASASSNHETLTLVFNANAPDSIVVAGGSLFLTNFVNSGGDLVPITVQRGDSTTYLFAATGPASLQRMFIGAQLRFAPRGGTFEDDINFAATFIRRITFVFDYESRWGLTRPHLKYQVEWGWRTRRARDHVTDWNATLPAPVVPGHDSA